MKIYYEFNLQNLHFIKVIDNIIYELRYVSLLYFNRISLYLPVFL